MSDDERKLLGERLRQAREDKGLSQEEVAKRLRIPRPSVSQIERGLRRVDALELTQLAKVYGRTVAFFAEGSSQPEELEMLARAAAELSDADKAEVLRFARYLRHRAEGTSDES